MFRYPLSGFPERLFELYTCAQPLKLSLKLHRGRLLSSAASRVILLSCNPDPWCLGERRAPPKAIVRLAGAPHPLQSQLTSVIQQGHYSCPLQIPHGRSPLLPSVIKPSGDLHKRTTHAEQTLQSRCGCYDQESSFVWKEQELNCVSSLLCSVLASRPGKPGS